MTPPETPPDSPFPDEIRGKLAEGTFLLVDKPRGPSSHQVTAWVRDLLDVEAAGHAGTLDPNVSGLLWVGVGPALKLLPLLLDFPKRYVAIIVLHGAAEPAEVTRVLSEFTGPVYQTPPVRSAVRRVRRVRTIHRLDLLERSEERLLLEIVADSGTYVRTLAVDVGDALGVGAHMEELRRVGTGPFREEASVPLTVLADAVAAARGRSTAPLSALLHNPEEVWREFPRLVLKDAAASAVAHGANLAAGGIASAPQSFSKGAHVVLVDRSARLLGFGRSLVDSSELKRTRSGWVVDTERVLASPDAYAPLWRSGGRPASAG